MINDCYHDSNMEYNVDWRIRTTKLSHATTLDGLTFSPSFDTHYIVQTMVENKWTDQYFCAINGEKMPKMYAWQITAQDSLRRQELEYLDILKNIK